MSTTALPKRPLAPLALLAAGALALAAALAPSAGPPEAPPPPAATVPAAPGPPVVPNGGQSPQGVRFEARAGAAALYFTPAEVVLAQPGAAVRLRFAGASPDPDVSGVGRGAGVVNDLRGSNPARWRVGVPTYAGVRYRGLYPGIDVRHDPRTTAAGPWVSTAFSIAPGADPARIRWRYAGAGAPWVDRTTGALRVRPQGGGAAVGAGPPVAWQRIDGRRVPVEARYRVSGDGTVNFALGRYDRGHPLLLAGAAPAARLAASSVPGVAYSTFLGGRNWDEFYDVDVDAKGDAYVTGFTLSPTFPVRNAQQAQFVEVTDVVVARVSADGKLVYSTYLGGVNMEAGHNIAVDSSGNAYVTGRTQSEDFPVRNALQSKLKGRRCQNEVPCHDAFVTKLDPRGRIVYSTYLGGTGNEEAVGIAVDTGGRAHIAGNTDSPDFPTRNAVQGVNRSLGCDGDLPCPFDSFVARLSPSGSALEYGTYLGGKAGELNAGVAVDSSGAAYVAGTTRSTDFPTRSALQSEIKGLACGPPPGAPCTDLYLTKLSSSGGLVYSTYLGGTKNDRAGGIAVDKQARAHLTGATESADFPLAGPVQEALDNSSCGTTEPLELCHDAFVTGVAAGGRSLAYSTYLGANAEDQGLGIDVADSGTVHVTGSTDSRQFRTVSPLQGKLAGRIDTFVARLAPGGHSLVFSTFLGGREDERFNGIAVDGKGASLLAGRTTSTDFPTANPAQGELAGDIDGVVVKLR